MKEWISVKDKLPKNFQEVVVVFQNHCPAVYYSDIKDKSLVGVCVYYNYEWYWYSQVTTELLYEYGKDDIDIIDKDIEIIYWQPLPEAPKTE